MTKYLPGEATADVARRLGWEVGTHLAGDEGFGESIIRITALGESCMLAKLVSHDGQPKSYRENSWTLACRDWREVSA